MHLVTILIGAFLGAAIVQQSDAFFGLIAGVLIASLLYKLAVANSLIKKLDRRLSDLELRANVPSRAEKSATPPVSAYQPAPTPADVSPKPQPASTLAPDPPAPEPAHEMQAKPVVHERVVETPPSPGPVEHALGVAKRWLTTGNVPVKLGVVILFFGVAFLLKYAVENSIFEIPIEVRYLVVAAFAALMLGIGWRMRASRPVYALSLQGGGIGVLFLIVFAAFRLHGILPSSIAFSLLVVLTVAAGVLAVRQESRALAILGTTGGFLAPLLVSTGSGNHVALFSYYLVLNCAVLGVAWVRAWRELNIIGFVFTFGVGTLWGLQYYTPEKFATTQPFLVLHFLFYTTIAILFAFRLRPQLRGYVDGTLVFGTPTIAFALQTQLLRGSEYGLAISAAIVAAFYAAIVVWLRQRQDGNFLLLKQSFVVLASGFATIAIPLAVDDRWTAIAWALEGSALVWIGVKQSGTLARLTGAALAIAGGLMFLNYGWREGLGWPVFNGNVFGGALIAVSSLFSARLLATDGNAMGWQRLASLALLIWGVGWWLATGSVEALDRAPSPLQMHLLVLFVIVSFAGFAYASKRLGWLAYQRVSLLLLPFLPVAALGYLIEHDHFFKGMGVVVWVLAIAAHLWVLYCYKRDERIFESLWHTAGAVFFVLLFAYEFYWQIDRVVLNDVWPASAALLVAAAFSFVFLRDARRWPLDAFRQAYQLAAVILTAGFLLVLTAVCIDHSGNASPLPYIPLLNPFDLLSLAGLYLLWQVIALLGDERWPLMLWGGSAFVLATLAVVRAVHHLTGVPWDGRALMQSVTVQTSLTIFWAALGLTGMLLGTRRGNRRIWMLGVGLMVVVVAKMAVIDLGNTGTVARIVSFLGVGIMLLVVGYFSPVPPRSMDASKEPA